MTDYSAWLIETDFGDGPAYHQFQMDDDWTSNQDIACHFARKQDAEQVIAYYGWTIAKAVEHMWPAKSVRYFIGEYTDGPATRWNVIDRQSQEWIRRFASKEEAQQYADKLNA